jgi:hypothetical protein
MMHRFEYRGPRFSVDVPVQFFAQNATLEARCTEISKEGMRLEVGEPLRSNSPGTVSLSHQGRSLQFSVRVVHVGARSCGLEFVYGSEAEQFAVAHLVESLAQGQHRPGPILLKHS